MKRCQWVSGGSELDIAYHDEEWGVPVHDDNLLFECLTLEGAQAGLSWATVLKKRENYRRLFAGFDVAKVAEFDEAHCQSLLQDAGIIRNRLKVYSTINNAQAILKLRDEFESFDQWIWSWVDGKALVGHRKSLSEVPSTTDLSDKISKDLKKRGFRFIGSTTCYAFLQAAGIVNDHTIDCFRFEACLQ